jgi:hypothetical protein
MQGASIELRDAQQERLGICTSNVEGKFVFADLASGSYTVIEHELPDYITTTAAILSVSIGSGDEVKVAFGVCPVATIPPDGVKGYLPLIRH